MHDLEAFGNRLRKVAKMRRKWAHRVATEAYRVYEMDIPEMRFIVDVYGDHAVVYDKRGHQEEEDEVFNEELRDVVAASLDIAAKNVHLKLRRRQQGTSQYEKLGESGVFLKVKEESSTYLVNLDDYLDTGLFLDHRPIRGEFRKLAPATRLLNLFCYTGSVSVAAAQAGAHVTSVDMSNTYLDWARENFRANGIDASDGGFHRFVREDALRYLEAGPARGEAYDVVFLDPPTFSNSKKMAGTWDVQRDHATVVTQAMRFVAPGGRLYFSTNRQRFVLDPSLALRYDVQDHSARSIPEDFRNKKAHRLFVLTPRPAK